MEKLTLIQVCAPNKITADNCWTLYLILV